MSSRVIRLAAAATLASRRCIPVISLTGGGPPDRRAQLTSVDQTEAVSQRRSIRPKQVSRGIAMGACPLEFGPRRSPQWRHDGRTAKSRRSKRAGSKRPCFRTSTICCGSRNGWKICGLSERTDACGSNDHRDTALSKTLRRRRARTPKESAANILALLAPLADALNRWRFCARMPRDAPETNRAGDCRLTEPIDPARLIV
jgi:hypothetical protein